MTRNPDPTAFFGWLRLTPKSPWNKACSSHDYDHCWHLLEMQAAHVPAETGSLVVLKNGVVPEENHARR